MNRYQFTTRFPNALIILCLLCFLPAVAVAACTDTPPTAVPTSAATATYTPESRRPPISTYTPTRIPTSLEAVETLQVASPVTAPAPTSTSKPTLTSTPTSAPVVETATSTPTPTATHEPSPAPTRSPTPTITPKPEPTATATHPPEPTPSATLTPTIVPSPTPTAKELTAVEISESIPWFVDPPDEHHASAAYAIAEILDRNLDTALTVSRIRWLVDGVTDAEVQALTAFKEIAALDAETLAQLVGLFWIDDGLIPAEIEHLSRIAESPFDPISATEVLGYHWVQDGITEFERSVWDALWTIVGAESDLARAVTTLDWVRDGVTRTETESLSNLGAIIAVDQLVGTRLVAMPWFRNGIGFDEVEALDGFRLITQRDPELAKHIADAPWIRDIDRLTSHQWEPIKNISAISSGGSDFTKELLDAIGERVDEFERHVLESLAFFRIEKREDFNRLREQQWFSDGLSREEMAFLITAHGTVINSPGDFHEMLTSRYTQSKTVDLPLSGNINIWAIQKTPFPENQDVTTQIEVALRALEGLTLTPMPTNDVIVHFIILGPESNFRDLAGNLDSPWPRAAHEGGHIRMKRDENAQVNTRALFHELAHYQFQSVPAWFLEGGANFAATYISQLHVEGSLEEWKANTDTNVGPGCDNGATNLHELGNVGIGYKASDNAGCFYSMGEHFLTSVFHTIGQDATSSALRDILAIPYSQNRPITSKDIFLAFHGYTSPDKETQFIDLFNNLHGGPLLGEWTDPDDYHGDVAANATALVTDVIVEGVLNHPFDVDYFAIPLIIGQKVLLTINHEIQDEYIGEDLYVALQTPNGVKPDGLDSMRGTAASMQLEWVVPASGDYYFALESTTGATGWYDLNIASIADTVSEPTQPSDASENAIIESALDQGDSPSEATEIAPGETIAGNLQNSTDVDYFKIQTVEGYGYEVFVTNANLEYSAVKTFGPDGQTRVENARWYEGFDSSSVRWAATEPGPNYLQVLSPPGNIGSYTISIKQIIPGGDDHGENAASATTIQLGQVVDASLEFSFDVDFFQFQAQIDQFCNILLNHYTVPFQPVTILAADGVTVLHEYGPAGGYDATGSLIPWQPTETGQFYIRFTSPDGDTGNYSLVVVSDDGADDDHGDTPTSSTELLIGDPVAGRLDQNHDFDYFRLETEIGKRYFIALDYDSTDPAISDLRVNVYVAEGLMEEYREKEDGRRQSGRFYQWPARETSHYIVVWSPQGDIGPYTLTVTGGSAN